MEMIVERIKQYCLPKLGAFKDFPFGPEQTFVKWIPKCLKIEIERMAKVKNKKALKGSLTLDPRQRNSC